MCVNVGYFDKNQNSFSDIVRIFLDKQFLYNNNKKRKCKQISNILLFRDADFICSFRAVCWINPLVELQF